MTSLQLEVEPTFLAVRALGPWLAEVLEPLGVERATAAHGGVELAIHELATNIVDHAQSTFIRFKASVDGDQLNVSIIDDGHAFDTEKIVIPAADQPQVRGYGFMIIEALSLRLDYERQTDRNVWETAFSV